MSRSIFMALVATLSGCAAAPGRENAHASHELTRGRVAPADVGRMADCVMDGFGRAHWMLTNIHPAQQRRSDGVRVETYAGSNALLVSVDIGDDGTATLTEMSNAKLIDTSGERAAFADCLARYAQPPG